MGSGAGPKHPKIVKHNIDATTIATHESLEEKPHSTDITCILFHPELQRILGWPPWQTL